jgi:hypothetical protein
VTFPHLSRRSLRDPVTGIINLGVIENVHPSTSCRSNCGKSSTFCLQNWVLRTMQWKLRINPIPRCWTFRNWFPPWISSTKSYHTRHQLPLMPTDSRNWLPFHPIPRCINSRNYYRFRNQTSALTRAHRVHLFWTREPGPDPIHWMFLDLAGPDWLKFLDPDPTYWIFRDPDPDVHYTINIIREYFLCFAHLYWWLSYSTLRQSRW